MNGGIKMGFTDSELNREQDVPTCEQCHEAPSEIYFETAYLCLNCLLDLRRQEKLDKLEELLDSTSLYEVLSMLQEICYAKEDHIRANWQDNFLANIWKNNASALEEAKGKVGG